MKKELKVACNMNLPVTLKEWVLARSKLKNSSFTGEVTYLLSEMKRQIEAEKNSFLDVEVEQEKAGPIVPDSTSSDMTETAEPASKEIVPVEGLPPKKVEKPKKRKKKKQEAKQEQGFFDWFF